MYSTTQSATSIVDFVKSFFFDRLVYFFFIEKKGESGILPAKCVFLLLKRLFYGVTLSESCDSNTNTYTSNVAVNYGVTFTSTSKISPNHARDLASIRAIQNLCIIENKFVQQKRNDHFPMNFADEIQRYGLIDAKILI